MSKYLLALLLLISVSIFLSGSSHATEWNIYPGNNIQTYIDSAAVNDTIIVNDNNGSEYTYQENLIVNKENLTIKSNGLVTINSSNPNSPIISITSLGNGSIIHGFCINGATNSSAISLFSVQNCQILKNQFNNSLIGIILSNGCNGIIISGNNFLNNSISTNCIKLNNGSVNCLISKNILFGPQKGRAIEIVDQTLLYGYSHHNNMTRNHIQDFFQGIFLGETVYYNTINLNTIYYCLNGIECHGNHNNMTENDLMGNHLGLKLVYDNNYIYWNNFLYNKLQAINEGLNFFNLTFPLGGNYWSDYTGVDDNNDDFGDTIYTFLSLTDYWPLIRPTWHVRSGESIQETIDHASYGGSIKIHSSEQIYQESLNINKKLKISSFEGNTTIKSMNPFTPVLNITSNGNWTIIQGLTIIGSSRTAAVLINANKCQIIDNTIKNNYIAVQILNASQNTLINNIIYENNKGISITNSSTNINSYNTFYSNNVGIELKKCNNTLIGNSIFNYNKFGIFTMDGYENEVSNNQFTNNFNKAIYLENSQWNYFLNNIVTGGTYGIHLSGGNYSYLVSNNVSNAGGIGIFLENTSYSYFRYNLLNENVVGTLLKNTTESMVEGNIIENNGFGMELNNPKYCNVNNQNQFSFNTCGLYIDGGDAGVRIVDNTFSNNNVAIELYNSSYNSPQIYVNHLIGNTYGIYAIGSCDVSNNLIEDIKSGGAGIFAKNGSIKITQNFIVNTIKNDAYGIYSIECDYGLISRNIIENFHSAIDLHNCNSFYAMEDNELAYNNIGLFMENCQYQKLQWNFIHDNEVGIDIFNCNNSDINETNQICNNNIGIFTKSSFNNRIQGNVFINNVAALEFFDSSSNIIEKDNYFSDNIYGIYLHLGSSNTIRNNYLQEIKNNGVGIYLENSANNIIINNTLINSVRKPTLGISVKGGSNNQISGNSGYNQYSGITISDSNNNELKNNTLLLNDMGITVINSNWNILEANNLTNNVAGFSLNNCNNNIINGNFFNNHIAFGTLINAGSENNITNNTFKDNEAAIKFISTQNNQITSNIIDKNSYGVYLLNSNGNLIKHSNILNLKPNGYGIYSINCTANQAINNSIENNNQTNTIGVYLQGGSSNILSENNISKQNNGINVYNSSFNEFYNNNLTDNNLGIYFYGGNEPLFSKNKMLNNSVGMKIIQSNHAKIIGNIVSNNTYGISLENFQCSIIIGNEFNNNQESLYLTLSSNNNLIYNNLFINNTRHIFLDNESSSNSFNCTKPAGGNYWSDYSGLDVDGDGYGDTPYNFIGGFDSLPYVIQIINVFPRDKIQDAVNQFTHSKIIIVHDNGGLKYTYQEKVTFSKKVWIRGDGDLSIKALTSNGNIFELNSLASGTKIEYLKFTEASTGILFKGAQNCTLQGNNFTCVNGLNCINPIIGLNLIKNNFYNSSALIYGSFNQISQNTFINGSNGIYLSNSENNTIINNTLENNYIGIDIDSYSSGNLISQNNIQNCSFAGIDVSQSSNNNITLNICNNPSSNYGIRLYYQSSYNNVTENSVINNSVGIQISETSNNNNIQRNLISNNYNGIEISWNSNSNQIIENNITHNTNAGIYLSSSGNTLKNNNINNNTLGMAVYNVNNNIYMNRIVYNNQYGIRNYASSTLNAENNWWGTNSGPGTAIYGNIDGSPWLVLSITATPSTLIPHGTSNITVDLSHNSNGTDVSSLGHVPNGLGVNFNTTIGNITPINGMIINGTFKTIFEADENLGIVIINAIIDNQTVNAQLNVN